MKIRRVRAEWVWMCYFHIIDHRSTWSETSRAYSAIVMAMPFLQDSEKMFPSKQSLLTQCSQAPLIAFDTLCCRIVRHFQHPSPTGLFRCILGSHVLQAFMDVKGRRFIQESDTAYFWGLFEFVIHQLLLPSSQDSIIQQTLYQSILKLYKTLRDLHEPGSFLPLPSSSSFSSSSLSMPSDKIPHSPALAFQPSNVNPSFQSGSGFAPNINQYSSSVPIHPFPMEDQFFLPQQQQLQQLQQQQQQQQQQSLPLQQQLPVLASLPILRSQLSSLSSSPSLLVPIKSNTGESNPGESNTGESNLPVVSISEQKTSNLQKVAIMPPLVEPFVKPEVCLQKALNTPNLPSIYSLIIRFRNETSNLPLTFGNSHTLMMWIPHIMHSIIEIDEDSNLFQSIDANLFEMFKQIKIHFILLYNNGTFHKLANNSKIIPLDNNNSFEDLELQINVSDKGNRQVDLIDAYEIRHLGIPFVIMFAAIIAGLECYPLPTSNNTLKFQTDLFNCASKIYSKNLPKT